MKNWFFILPLIIFIFAPAKQPARAAKIDSIRMVIDQDQLILPGETFKIGIVAYKRNGKVRRTLGMPGGTTFWWKYKVDVVGGSDFGGRITVNEELSPSKGKYISIEAYPRRHPELKQKVYVPLNYETDIDFYPTNHFDKAPGCQIEGEISSLFNNEIVQVYDKLKRKKEAENFQFIPEGAWWEKGRLTIDPDFRNIRDHRVNLIVNAKNNQAVADTFSVLLDYKHAYQLNFQGRPGYRGSNGISGSNGSAGCNGSDGQSGENGGYGSNGPDIGVWVDLYHDSILNTPLLYVYAQNQWTGQEYRYLLNPDGGRLTVSSRGGSGGDGGNGGSGGDGGRGRDGRIWIEKRVEKKIVRKPFKEKRTVKEEKTVVNSEGKEEKIEVEKEIEVTVYKDVEEEVVIEIKHQGPGEDGGDGGWGGAGGFAGPGGDGGNITLYFTDDARPYRKVIAAYCPGGSGGKHGYGGNGGRGGQGGDGNPRGRNGSGGQSGPSRFGWADSGWTGRVDIKPTEEFFFYVPREELTGQHPVK